MTEIDKKENIQQSTISGTRRSVLARFVATFSGGLSPNTVNDSGIAALAVASARMDTRKIHHGLKKGGNSTTILQGSFLDFVPVDGKVENALQKLPGSVIHVTEPENIEPLEEAPKPAVIDGNTPALLGERPSRVFHINVFSASEEPDANIRHWFIQNTELKPAA